MLCQRGDAVLVPFPFSDATTAKKRPAVVISTDRFNAGNLDVLVVAVTHSPHAIHRAGAVRLDDAERTAGGLDRNPFMAISVVVSSKIACVARARVLATRGRLPSTALDRIVDALLSVVR